MNYVYNIKVNLKDKLYNFYEWNNEDNILILNKVIVYLVNEETYNDILNMRIKVKDEFLKNIKLNNNICIFSNDIDCVCVKFNNDGVIELISKLDLEEESDILDEVNFKNRLDLKYTKINKSNNYSFNTRREDEIVSVLNDYIKNEKNNIELIDYLYNEWFNSNRCKNKYDKLLHAINGKFSVKHEELYDVIKLLNV